MKTNTCRSLTTLLLSGILEFSGAPGRRGQAGPAAGQGDWEVPRTPDGRPDLKGNWPNATVTPFERPVGQGPAMTWKEVAQVGQRAELQALAATLPSDPNRPPLMPEAQAWRPDQQRFNRQFGAYHNLENRPIVERCIILIVAGRAARLMSVHGWMTHGVIGREKPW